MELTVLDFIYLEIAKCPRTTPTFKLPSLIDDAF